jgi:hypothetical protein
MKYPGPIEDQPENGFESEEEVEKYLINKMGEKRIFSIELGIIL